MVESARAAAALFEAFFESAPDAMVVVDGAGKITHANRQSEALFQYSRSELLGEAAEKLVPERFRRAHTGHRLGYFGSPRVRPMGVGLDLFGVRKDGSEFPVDIMLSPIDTAEGRIVLAVVRDITERIMAEEQEKVRRELRQKELLLQEIHHRVKNNLQVVSSLLNLQAQAVGDERVGQLFKDAQERVNAMALIHEQLYQSPGSHSVQFDEYVRSLVARLLQSHGGETRGIQVDLTVEAFDLPIDTAIPCGLIVSELVSNALKHAFPPGRTGTVTVRFQREEERYVLTVRDNGIGLRPRQAEAARSTLGLQMVPALATQLSGSFMIAEHPEGGTDAVLEFPMPSP